MIWRWLYEKNKVKFYQTQISKIDYIKDDVQISAQGLTHKELAEAIYKATMNNAHIQFEHL